MLNFVLSKTIFRKSPYAKELSKINHGICVVKTLTFLIYYLLGIGPILFIALPLSAAVKTEVPIKIQLFLSIPIVIYYGIVFIFMKYFKDELINFRIQVEIKLHFKLYVPKGKVLTKQDFQIIQNTNKDLYFDIKYNLIKEHCFYTCFEILQALKTGEMWFIAAKNLLNNAELPYYFHVAYVRNGWLYDTDVNQQFTIGTFQDIRHFKIYKKFTYPEIESLKYEEFLEKERPGIEKWCAENNCSTLEHSEKTQDCK